MERKARCRDEARAMGRDGGRCTRSSVGMEMLEQRLSRSLRWEEEAFLRLERERGGERERERDRKTYRER